MLDSFVYNSHGARRGSLKGFFWLRIFQGLQISDFAAYMVAFKSESTFVDEGVYFYCGETKNEVLFVLAICDFPAYMVPEKHESAFLMIVLERIWRRSWGL